MIAKVLRNKKGVAMELAVITMLVIFGLCIILLTVAEMTAYSRKRVMTLDNEHVILDTIGDDFVSAQYNRTDFNPARYSSGDYLPVVYGFAEGDNRLMVVYKQSTSTPKLAVEVQGTGDDCRVILWSRAESFIKDYYVLDIDNALAAYAGNTAI